jgi:hypothetical protein
MVTHSTCESSVSLTPSATGPRTYAFMLVDVLDQSVHGQNLCFIISSDMSLKHTFHA